MVRDRVYRFAIEGRATTIGKPELVLTLNQQVLSYREEFMS